MDGIYPAMHNPMPVLLSVFEIAYLHPAHHRYPIWPGKSRLLQLFRTIAGTQVVVTRGLANEKTMNYEIYLETDELIEPGDFSNSWQASLIYETGRIIPEIRNLAEKIHANQYLSVQITMDNVPREWSIPYGRGNTGLFIGMHNPSIAALTSPAIPLNIKLMRPLELLYSIEQEPEGRHHQLAHLYEQQGKTTISNLTRKSVV